MQGGAKSSRSRTFEGASESVSVVSSPAPAQDKFLEVLAEQVADAAVRRMAEKLKAFDIEPLMYSMEESARKVGLSLSTIKTMISEKQLPVVRCGARVLISRKAIDEWIRRNEC